MNRTLGESDLYFSQSGCIISLSVTNQNALFLQQQRQFQISENLAFGESDFRRIELSENRTFGESDFGRISFRKNGLSENLTFGETDFRRIELWKNWTFGDSFVFHAVQSTALQVRLKKFNKTLLQHMEYPI